MTRERYDRGMKHLAVVALATLALTGCVASPEPVEAGQGQDPSIMLNVCVSKVATWAGSTTSEVSGDYLAGENPSGLAWDFSGTYPGGSWRCGGPSNQAEPTSVVVYPEAGSMQDIVDGGSPPVSSDASSGDPAAVLAGLVAASGAPSESCMSAMSSLADTPYSASEATVNAAVTASVEACTTVGEYILAFKAYPGAWGLTDASYIDGIAALITIQSACYGNDSAPACLDAEANGLL